MKRIVFLFSLLAVFFLSFANPVEFKECVPNSGDNVTAWDFELKFDISKALEAAAISNPGAEVGLGVYGSASQNATLYEGDSSDNNILGVSFNKTINGNSDAFVVNGNSVKFSFDSTIPIKKGQKYTIEIKNDFYLYIKGKTSRISSTRLPFRDSPLVLTFYGGDVESSQLYVEGCSLESGTELESLNSLSFNLSAPFSIVDGGKVIVKDGDTVIASTSLMSVSETDQKQLTAVFEQPINLSYGKEYTVELPEGSVVLKENPGIKNFLYQIKVKGTSAIYFGAKSHTPDGNGAILPETASIYFDVPDGKTLLPKSGKIYSGHTTCTIYTEGDEQNEIRKGGDVTSDGKGITWDLSNIIYSPSTTYFLKKEKGSIYVFDEAENHLPEYVNDEVTISWTTPSAEEIGLPRITADNFGKANFISSFGGSSSSFVNGGKYASIWSLNIDIIRYQYQGKEYSPAIKQGLKAKIYDVTSGSRVLVKEIDYANDRGETAYEYYTIGSFRVETTAFYQGRKYEIVIPENALYVNIPALKNFVLSDEIVYSFEGATPTQVKLVSKSIADGAVLSELPSMVWVFEGDFSIKEDAVAHFASVLEGSTGATRYDIPLRRYNLSGKTYVSIVCLDEMTGLPKTFLRNTNCTITLPAGSIYYPTDESVCNKEIVTSFKGVVKSSSNQESVAVNLNVNGVHSTSHKAVKGEAYEFSLAHDNNWVVESVKHNGADVASANGTYTTASLTEADNNIEASLKFAHNVSIADFTTGVGEVIADGSAISIGKDGDSVVVKGLKGGEHISVYALNGMMVKDAIVGANMDSARISLPADSVLIILVESADESQAFKVKL